MITDTHCHLYETCFDDLDKVVALAHSNGVDRFIIPNVDTASIEPIRKLIAQYSCFYAAMGLHPTYVNERFNEELRAIKQEVDRGDCIAIGEVGIDLYWSRDFLSQQQQAFETQVKWSIEKQLPLIIHSRDAFDEVFEVLELYKGSIKGVFHSFTAGKREAERIINDFDFYFGINGVVTYKNSTLKEIIPMIPQSRLILETDSPYLSPVPCRGKRNEPANLSHISSFLLNLLGENRETFEKRIEDNVKRLFRI